MKVFLAVSALVAVSSAAVAPIIIIPSAHLAHGPPDSAIVQTERRGNGFTYSIAEARGIEPVGTVQSLGSIWTPWDQLPLISTLNGQQILLTTIQRSDEVRRPVDRSAVIVEQPETEPSVVNRADAKDQRTNNPNDRDRQADINLRSGVDSQEDQQDRRDKADIRTETKERSNLRDDRSERRDKDDLRTDSWDDRTQRRNNEEQRANLRDDRTERRKDDHKNESKLRTDSRDNRSERKNKDDLRADTKERDDRTERKNTDDNEEQRANVRDERTERRDKDDIRSESKQRSDLRDDRLESRTKDDRKLENKQQTDDVSREISRSERLTDSNEKTRKQTDESD